MSSKVIQCDSCGAQRDTGERLDGNAYAEAKKAGWLVQNPWVPEAGAKQDICLDCRAKAMAPVLLTALCESEPENFGGSYIKRWTPNDYVIDGHFDWPAFTKRVIRLFPACGD